MQRLLAAPLLWLERSSSGSLLVPLAFLLVFYVVPLIGVVLVSLLPGGAFSVQSYGALAADGAFWGVIARTLRLALLVSLACLILGYPYAYVLTRANAGVRRVLIGVVMLPFLTSILIRSYAWVAILGRRGPVNAILVQSGLTASPLALVYNEIGALIGMSQIQLPLMILTLYGAMRRIDPDLMRAAEGLGAHRIVSVLQIFVRLSWPGVVSGLGLVFTSTLGFYVTPALLGGPSEYMITQAIYVRLNTIGDFSGAAAQATILLVVVVGLLYALRHVLGTLEERAPADGHDAAPRRGGTGIAYAIMAAPEMLIRRLGRAADWLYWLLRALLVGAAALAASLLAVTMITVIPLGLSGDSYLRFPPSSFSLRWVAAYLGDEQWLKATFFSLWLSACGAVVATVLASAAAYAIERRSASRSKAGLELFFISPMILPQFVTALALYFVFIRLGLVGSPATYILAYGVFAFPYVFLVMYAAFQRFDHSLVQAGESLGATPATVWRRITIPVLLPSFVSAGAFAFLVAFDDLVVGLFFSTAGRYTLPMRMWGDIRNEISPQIAAVAVVFLSAALLLVGAFSLARSLARRRPSVAAATSAE